VSDDGSTFGVFVENGRISLRVVLVNESSNEPVVITPAFWRALNMTGTGAYVQAADEYRQALKVLRR
jgi:hypothetical protein